MRWESINWERVDWTPASFLIGYHLVLFITLPIYLMNYTPGWKLLLGTFVIYYLTGLCLTAGQHRLYSHKAYEANNFVESIMLFFITSAAEGSALDWSHDHRLHHKHVDSDKDPYNVEEGLLHAHFLWMLEKKDRYYEKVVPDLLKNKLVMFQHKHYGKLFLLTNVVLVGALYWLTQDLWGAFVIGFLGRLFFVHHSTWFINSLAHYWGAKPFSKEHSAVNNYIIAMLTWGEGYHNYHHSFERDYRNGVWWYQFDPTKALIWLLNKVGLAKNLNKVREATVRKAMLMKDKKAMLRAVTDQDLKEKIKEMHEDLVEKIQQVYHDKNNDVKEAKKRLKKE